MVQDKLTIIVGAGLTGLSCGYYLVSGQKKCLLIEQESVVGGQARSLIFQDCIFDLGPHVLFCNNNSPGIELIKELFKSEEYIITDFTINFFLYGKYYNLPLSPLDFLNFPIPTALSFLKAIIRRQKKQTDFKSDMTSILGEKMYQDYFGPFIEKKLMISGNKLHTDWWRRLKRNYKNDILEHNLDIETIDQSSLSIPKKLMLAIRNISKIVFLPKDKLLYPKNGIQMIPQRLLEFYSQYGGETLLNTEVVGLKKSNSSITAITFKDKNGQEKEMPLKNLIWTGSVCQLCKLLDIDAELTYISCALVFVVIKRKLPKIIKSLYTYYIQKDIIFNRIYYPSHIYEKLVPEGWDALCVEITLKEALKSLGKNKTIEKVRDDLEKLGLVKPEDIETMEYIEITDAYPVYPVDYRERIKKIFDQLLQYKNLYPVGRMGSFYFSMMPDVIELGEETAKHILSTDG
ncbi:MAG: hypothetical protein A3F91_08065 [Flavobacteria bacterium RIFCSPLOWO2_12_FULL_35_11]|nr:MAG: hypothetical protein A3F91_08065 [Flavobacteria bacterium RIFCSPLOWO2_12_FULL_35_11]